MTRKWEASLRGNGVGPAVYPDCAKLDGTREKHGDIDGDCWAPRGI